MFENIKVIRIEKEYETPSPPEKTMRRKKKITKTVSCHAPSRRRNSREKTLKRQISRAQEKYGDVEHKIEFLPTYDHIKESLK